MANIQPVGFLDVSVFAASLRLRHWEKLGESKLRAEYPGSAHHDTESILLRGPRDPTVENWFDDVEQINYPLLDEWKPAKNLLLRLRNAVAPLNGGKPGKLGKVMIASLKSGGHVDWHRDEGAYAAAHQRFHVGIVPSYDSFLLSGGQMLQVMVGQLVYFNNHIRHSAINDGEFSRVHLIADIRR